MAIVVIRYEEDIKAYIDAFMLVCDEIKAVEFVDVGEDHDEMVKNYFANKYQGTVLFLGMYEHGLSIKNSLSWNNVACQVTILKKHNKQKPGELIAVRKATKEAMIKLMHWIKNDQAETQENSHNSPNPAGGNHWSFRLHNDMLFPVGDINNSGCRGWSVDFDIGFPVTEID